MAEMADGVVRLVSPGSMNEAFDEYEKKCEVHGVTR